LVEVVNRLLTKLFLSFTQFTQKQVSMSSSKKILSQKSNIIQQHQIHDDDTGSPEVQIAILTAEIKNLTEHLKKNPKDYSSRVGLLRKVGRRARLLRYLSSVSLSRYKKTIAANNIKDKLSAGLVASDNSSDDSNNNKNE
jgi:ribosomal protein S15, bacterial/organelle